MAKTNNAFLKYFSNLAGINLYQTTIIKYCRLIWFTVLLIISFPIILFVEFVVGFLVGLADTIVMWVDEKEKIFNEEN
ncbi:hypothetical protein M0R19_05565 [Candidatus Pacearchaeota archaeon]|jgi:purine-cytosine permease-like protein|nr:hypothetical protein [Candidatus Pacearchaeota archaeon]